MRSPGLHRHSVSGLMIVIYQNNTNNRLENPHFLLSAIAMRCLEFQPLHVIFELSQERVFRWRTPLVHDQRCCGYVIQVEELFEEQTAMERRALLSFCQADDFPKGCVTARKHGGEVKVIFERPPSSDGVGFGGDNLLDAKHFYAFLRREPRGAWEKCFTPQTVAASGRTCSRSSVTGTCDSTCRTVLFPYCREIHRQCLRSP